MDKVIHRVCDQTLQLMPERAIYWQEQQALLVADLHLGKEGTFRSAGIPLPDGPTADTLQRLERALEKTAATKLYILGDLFHGEHAIAAAASAFTQWRRPHPELAVHLIAASHDRWSGAPPAEWAIQIHQEPFTLGPFALNHYPKENPGYYTLAGHLHPGYRLSSGRKAEKLSLPCFVFRQQIGYLPAFGIFTGLTHMKVEPDEAGYLILEDQVQPLLRVLGSPQE